METRKKSHEVGRQYHPDGAILDVLPSNSSKFSLEELQTHIGGIVVRVPKLRGSTITVWMLDGWQYQGQPRNYKAAIELAQQCNFGVIPRGRVFAVRKEQS